MVTKGGREIFQNNWNGNQISSLGNPPVKTAANGANTSHNKECTIDGQDRHLQCNIISALHFHHQHSSHLQGLFYKKLGCRYAFKSLEYLGESAVSFLSSCLNLKPLLRSDKIYHSRARLQSIFNYRNIYFFFLLTIISFIFNCIIL